MKHYKTLPTKLVQKERSRFDKSFKNVRKSVGKSAEDVVKIYFTLAEKTHNAIPKSVRWLARKFIFSSWFLLFISRTSAKHVAGHPEGWQIQYKQGDG